MNIDKAREYVVIVNGGSGCLMHSMTDEYMYVLTAKHNINNNNNLEKITYFIFRENNWVEKNLQIGLLTEGENYFPHLDKDIAILKIQFLQDYKELYRLDCLAEDKNDFHLLGYPEIRRKGNPQNINEWFRRDNNLQINDPRNNGQFEAAIPGSPTINEVRGDSGGCLMKIINDKLYVAGIQNSMADANEQLGRVRFTTLNSFDEIIKLYPEKLAPIFPCYLKSFSFLKNEAFNLYAGFADENIKYVKNYLKNKTQEVVTSPLTPIGIKKMFENRLLLFNQTDEVLQSKSVWVIWLEFLTILNILKNENCTEDNVKDVFNSIRLICSDSQRDWSEELTNIVYSDYRELKKNGTVVIGISKPPADDETYILEKKIPHIANAIKAEKQELDRSLLRIDDGINFPLEDYRFIHIEYFKKQAIIKKHADYAEIEDDAILLEKLKTEYLILLKNE
jgi:hypothetical protein